jgi:hypothetical protein
MGAEDQPRDENGRFAGGGGLNVQAWAKHLVGEAERKGGFTVRPEANRRWVPQDGIMVSRAPSEGHGKVVEIRAMAKSIAEREPAPTRTEARKELRGKVLAEVEKWLDEVGPAIQKLGPDHYLGGWHEKDEHGAVALHLDVSQRFSSQHKDKALAAGRERNQLAVWDIGKKEEIPTGGTGR